MIRLRFPLGKSITYVLRSRYDNLVAKELRKFEKIDYSLWKCKLYFLTVLIACLQNNIISKILNFFVSNSYEKDFNNRKEKLRGTVGIVNYTHVICFFLTQNDRKLAHHQNIHSKKLFNLGLEFSKVSHDADKIIFNYSSYTLYFINDCSDEFKPVYYKRYVNDIFALFRSPHHLEIFNEHLKTC